MASKSSIDLSIIVAAHSEGLIAHKTIKSIERAVKFLLKDDISYEILATLDRPDEATRDYFSRYKDNTLKVYEVDFGDLAASRNFGIQNARGKYIALVDADDLVSDIWFWDALKILKEAAEDLVLHTEYSVNFGTKNIVWRKFDSQNLEREALMNVQANQWDSAIVATKELLERFPFQPNQNGFGPEDWHFNCQTLAAGIAHRIVPNTVLFVRRKDISVMSVQRTERHTMHYTDLQAFELFRRFDAPKFIPQVSSASAKSSSSTVRGKKLLKESLRAGYALIRQVPALGKYVQRVGRVVRTSKPPVLPFELPDWLLAEWRAIHVIEKQLYPSRHTLAITAYYESEMYELGIFYWRLVQYTHHKPDYLLFVPYLTRGGADLFAINYANSLAKNGYKVTVVATEQGSYELASRLEETVDFVPFGQLAEGLAKDLQLEILIRFVIQSKARVLHVLHSGLGFDLVEVYKTFFSKNDYTILSNAFCDDVDNDGKVSGHIHSGLPRIYQQIAKIFTDNSRVISQLEEEYAFDRSRFVVHHQPIKLPAEAKKWSSEQKYSHRFLWAGRIAKQKRPDLLLAIAKSLEKDNVVIDVFGSFQDGYSDDFFASASNVNYRGGFSSFADLPYNEYAALIYTTERDGLPNLLVEAASVSLPAIAPDIGGVGDVVGPETGILIDDPEDVHAFAEAVRSLVNSPQTARKLGRAARGLVEEKHDPSVFEKEVKRDIEVYISK